MIGRVRGIAAIAGLAMVAGALASCAGSTSQRIGSTEEAEGDTAATDRRGRRVRLTPRAAILAAFRSWQRKNHGDAVKLASYAINSGRLRPRGRSLALFVRGLAYHSLQRHAAAEADYTAAISADPRNHLAYHSRGLVRTARNDNHGAIADLSTAISIRPRYTSYYIRGLVSLKLRRVDDAYQDATAILSLRPNRYHGYYLRGLTRHLRGQRRLAAADYRRALEINPRHKGARRALSIVNKGRPGPPIVPRRRPDVKLLPIGYSPAR
jgi:tetratricopeptide (TPR) repeat protein